jgi:hypothetical protein
VIRRIANAGPLCRITSSNDGRGGVPGPIGFFGGFAEMERNVVSMLSSCRDALENAGQASSAPGVFEFHPKQAHPQTPETLISLLRSRALHRWASLLLL